METMHIDRYVVKRLPAYWLFDRAILGNFSLTTPKERYIINDFAFEYNGQVETPSHHFSEVFKGIQIRKKMDNSLALSYPYKASPCRVPYAFYLDIKHAYAQIADVYGIETTFKEGRYVAYGDTPSPQLCHDNKICRALLVSGTGKLSSITEWKNHELHSRKFYNRNYAPYIRYAIIATLHAIQSALDKYSIYAHTDGFICPSWHIRNATKLLDEYGILYSIKAEGITRINGVGSYSIGNISTRNAHHQTKERKNIRRDFQQWWLNAFRRGKEYRTSS